MMKRLIMLMLVFTIVGMFHANAQILNPVKWSYAAKRTANSEAVLFLKATIESPWHIYSVAQPDGGPVKTTFTFTPSQAYTLIGKVTEQKAVKKYEEVFKMDVFYFEKAVIFQQKIKLKAGTAVVKGKLEYMTCNDEKCLPPEELEFSIPVK